MRERPYRHSYSCDDCNCCIILCSPCIVSFMFLEKIIQCICFCPCYSNYVTHIQSNKIVIPQNDDIKIVIPELNDDIKNRYTGKIWGILR